MGFLYVPGLAYLDLALPLAAVGLAVWLRRISPQRERQHRAVRWALIATLTVLAALLGLDFGFVGLFLYFPLIRLFTRLGHRPETVTEIDPGGLEFAAYWLQAAVMSAVVVYLMRHRPIGRIPVTVFALCCFGTGAWMCCYPSVWLPHPT